MSYSDSAKPKIRFLLGQRSFNALIQALKDNTADEYADEHIIQKAHALIDKITRHARSTTDDNGDECVDVRFFDNEAKALIGQFIFRCAGNAAAADYYGDLLAQRGAAD
jgi:hypothetical protein